MKFYLATRKVENARPVRDALVAAGHLCVSSWVDEPGYALGSTSAIARHSDEELRAIASRDEAEIRDTDVLVVVAEPDGAFVPGGKHVETGMALALGKPVHVLGARENLFHWHPLVAVHADLAGLTAALARPAGTMAP